ncbi:MAG: DUF433 domain-containing protein [Parvularculaceae bacterium]
MPPKLVADFTQVVENIERFNRDLAQASLAEKIAYVRAWYAVKAATGEWLFAPSKFAGYVGSSAESYRDELADRDGRETERGLSQWFVEADPNDRFGRELLARLRETVAAQGKVLNALARVHVPKDIADAKPAARPGSERWRITADERVLGGKPCIRGLRIRVADILEMLANGASPEEIVADYPYLEAGDIRAALEYAIGAVDHQLVLVA